MIVLLIAVFCAGYLMGKKAAVDMFTHDVNEQSFADRLHHSMTTLYGPDQTILETAQPSDATEPDKELVVPQAAVPHPQQVITAQPQIYFYAQIARYNVEKSAQDLMARLQKRGIATTLVKRVSSGRTKDGKPIKSTWYVVQTKTYPTRHEIEALISSIKLTEPSLKKIRLMETKNRAQ
jgi:hypothetical protein